MPLTIASPARAAARLAISSFVRQAYSANQIINTLRGMGLSYRRQTMLSDIREFTGLHKLEGLVRQTNPLSMFPVGAMVQTDLRRGRRYRIYARITGMNKETGELFEKTISWYDDTRDSKQGWIDRYLEDRALSERYPVEEIHSIEISSVEHQSGWPY